VLAVIALALAALQDPIGAVSMRGTGDTNRIASPSMQSLVPKMHGVRIEQRPCHDQKMGRKEYSGYTHDTVTGTALVVDKPTRNLRGGDDQQIDP
jgi:hypothetical protein